MPRKKRSFTEEFKSEAVKLVLEGGRKASEVAKSHDLAPSLLAGWVRQARVDSGDNPSERMTTTEREDYARLKREHRELKREHEFLKKNSEILRGDETMRFVAIEAQRGEYPVRWMCRLLKVSSSGFYAWKKMEGRGHKTGADQTLALLIRAAYQESRKRYGSPRIHRQLRRSGVRTSAKRVARLMREEGLVGRSRRRHVKTTVRDDSCKPAENVLNRDFTASKSNEKWVTDITYLTTKEGWVFLAVILDLFSRRVVGYAMADNMRVGLCLQALEQAVTARQPAGGLLHHSDRGSQYASAVYQQALQENGMVCSMSRRGECWDNSVAESFFGRLKEELAHDAGWETRAEAMIAVSEYIDGFYNSKRIQKGLNYLCPMEYELYLVPREKAA